MALFNFGPLLMLCFLPFVCSVPVNVVLASNATSLRLNNGRDLTPLVYHIPDTRETTPLRAIFSLITPRRRLGDMASTQIPRPKQKSLTLEPIR